MATNDLASHLGIFDGVTPFSGYVESGFTVDFVGQRTDARFWSQRTEPADEAGDCEVQTRLPVLSDGEDWFEYYNWFAAAREARGSYVMMTLGSCFGLQVVGSYLALQAENPMPAMLVAVDAVPENMTMTERQFRNNGINPDDHWMVEAALGADNKPILFPIGSPGSGAQGCTQTNSGATRMEILDRARRAGATEQLAKSLMLRNSTSLVVDLAPGSGHDFTGEITFVSAVTLKNLMAPFPRPIFRNQKAWSSRRSWIC